MDQTTRVRAGSGRTEGRTEGRNETPEERLDRLWSDLLQELRVMQTGAQLIAGFLLTLPFQQRFTTLDTAQRALYLGLVILALLTTGLIMTAVAVHQRLSGRHIKERVVHATRRLVRVILTTLSLLIMGISVLLFDMVANRWLAVAVGAAFGVLLALLLIGLPRKLLNGSRDTG
jgi:hypothetical protein